MVQIYSLKCKISPFPSSACTSEGCSWPPFLASRSFRQLLIMAITSLSTVLIETLSFAQQDLIHQMHDLGVAHNDLRNPSNTLLTPDGKPVLVDLVACFIRGPKWNVANNYVFNKFSQVDLSAITKLKQRFAPELINSDDIHAEHIAGTFGLKIKALGQLIRRLSRKLFTS